MSISTASAAPSPLPRRLLSSAFTLFMKYLFPAIWILGFGGGTVAVLMSQIESEVQNPHAPPALLFCAMWLIGTVMLIFYCGRIKRVSTDDSNLYISNFLEEIKVPLSNVETVTEIGWINQRPVTIRFRSPTRFGKSVMFIPRQRFFGFWSTHPVVLELRQLANIEHREALPAVALCSTASKIPGSNWMAARLAGWDKANPKTFVTVNLVLGLLVGLSNGAVLLTDGRGIPPAMMELTRYVTLPICGLLALSALIGLAQPDTRRGVLRLHGVLLLAAAILLIAWMADIARDAIPRHTSFSWSPGVTELAVCYAVFLFTRYTLRSDAHKNAVIFYLPAWVLIPVVALEMGVLVRIGEMFFAPFSGP